MVDSRNDGGVEIKWRAFLVMLTAFLFNVSASDAADDVVVVANDRHPPALSNPSEIMSGLCNGKHVEVRLARKTKNGPKVESSATVIYDRRIVANLQGSDFAHDWTAPNLFIRKTVFCSDKNNFLIAALGVRIEKDATQNFVYTNITIRDGKILHYNPPTIDRESFIANFTE